MLLSSQSWTRSGRLGFRVWSRRAQGEKAGRLEAVEGWGAASASSDMSMCDLPLVGRSRSRQCHSSLLPRATSLFYFLHQIDCAKPEVRWTRPRQAIHAHQQPITANITRRRRLELQGPTALETQSRSTLTTTTTTTSYQ